MAKSTTRIVKMSKLVAKPDVASVAIRMMLAVSDAAFANTALRDWSFYEDRKRKGRARAARMYFSRVQMGHALESLKIIEEIRASPVLSASVGACDKRTRTSFKTLESFLDSDDFKLLLRIRNDLSFHYSPKLTKRALLRMFENDPTRVFSFSLGTEPLDWHFSAADEIVDSIMVRDVLGVPTNQSAQPLTDAVLDRLWEMHDVFADFAAYYGWHHLST